MVKDSIKLQHYVLCILCGWRWQVSSCESRRDEQQIAGENGITTFVALMVVVAAGK